MGRRGVWTMPSNSLVFKNIFISTALNNFLLICMSTFTSYMHRVFSYRNQLVCEVHVSVYIEMIAKPVFLRVAAASATCLFELQGSWLNLLGQGWASGFGQGFPEAINYSFRCAKSWDCLKGLFAIPGVLTCMGYIRFFCRLQECRGGDALFGTVTVW